MADVNYVLSLMGMMRGVDDEDNDVKCVLNLIILVMWVCFLVFCVLRGVFLLILGVK